MVDVETSGPVFGRHSLTEIGAVVGSKARGIVDRIEVLIQPTSDEQVTSPASFARARDEGEPAAQAMARFAAWAKPWVDAKASFIARPAAFDWPWIAYYARTYLGDNPFGYKAVCASSWFEALGKRFSVKLPHVAVEDAEIQLLHFLAEG
jgi:DNA polymerase III epsilon subunit-like protein